MTPVEKFISDHHNRLLSVIAGGIRSTIDAHGPLTKEFCGSAAKRALGNLKSYVKDRANEETKKEPPMSRGG